MTKAIFFDVDGTLVSFKTHQISPAVRQALQALRERGIKLFLSTGRHLAMLDPVRQVFDFDGYVTLSGQYCTAQGQVLRSTPMPPEAVEELVAAARTDAFSCIFLEGEEIYINCINEIDVYKRQDQNWAIGKDGEQLLYLSQDLKRFKALTLGHAVILGRRTLSTFPGGRPLKGRRNLILSTTPDFAPEGGEVYPSLDALLAAAPADAFVIGGESVYRALLDRCGTAYVTKILAQYPADRYFPDLDADPRWESVEESELLEENGVRFRYVTYRRRQEA